MILTSKSWALLAFSLVLAAFVAIAWRPIPPPPELPRLPAVPMDAVRRVTMGGALQKVVIERVVVGDAPGEADAWRIVAPIEAPADTTQVRALLRILEPGVPMEVRADEGDLKAYGLDTEGTLDLQLYTDGEDPALHVAVGREAVGASSFVRLPGTDQIYRANVGGRARLERPAAEWRDRTVLDVAPGAVTRVEIIRSDGTIRLERTEAPTAEGQPGRWALDGGIPADDGTVGSLLAAISRLRASKIHNPTYEAGLDAPAARLVLTLDDGSTRGLLLGRPSEGDALVRVDDRPEVFRVAGGVGRALLVPEADLRDRRLFRFQPEEVAEMSYVERGYTVALAPDDRGAGWVVTQPANVAADQRLAAAAAAALGALRASAALPDGQFAPSGARFVVRLRDARTLTLEIGAPAQLADGKPAVRVRSSELAGVFLLDQALYDGLRRSFGRG